MREKFKSVVGRDREFLKISFLSLFSNSLKIASSFIIGKVMAMIAGPVGLLLAGQLSNSISLLYAFSSLGLNNAIIKKVAELGINSKDLKIYLETALLIMSLTSGVISLGLLLFSTQLANWILSDPGYFWVFIITGFGLPFYIVGQYLLSLFNGCMDYKRVIYSNMVINLLVLICSVVLIYLYQIKGALLASSGSLLFYFIVPLINKKGLVKGIGKPKFHPETLRALFSFSLMFIFSSTAIPISQMLQRGLIADQINPVTAGYWEAINRISTMISLFLSSTLSIYYLPKLSSAIDGSAVEKEVRRVALYLFPLSLLVLILVYLLRDFLLDFLFDASFSILSPILIWQLPGDLMRIISVIYANVLIAKERTSYYIFGELMTGVLLFCLTFLLIPNWGLKGASMAYSLSYFSYLIFVWGGYQLRK